VTRHNFKARLPEIEEAIRTSSFISLDGEFTGLHTNRGLSPFDLPEHRYQKLQESSRQFLLVQFGLCTFHYNAESDSYSNQAYNFYVWPRPCSRQAPDPRFLCQTSSLDFLISQDFDFNKLFKDGLSYLRPAELEKLRGQTLDRQEYRRGLNSNTPETNVVIPEEQEGFLRDVSTKLNNFLNSDKTNLEIDRCNAFQRRLVYQTAREKFPGLSLTGLNRPGGERVISVGKDPELKIRMVQDQEQSEISELEDAFGFSRVIQVISESQKLVVGHNMALDICHTLNQFCSPLPTQYSDFKEMCSSILPNIVDTKLMANTIPFKDEIYNTALKDLLTIVMEQPYQLPKITQKIGGVGYKVGDEKYHEAGYDAFITGLCFISMHRRLTKICGGKPRGVDAETPEIRPFLNKLYLMKVNDIPYMNLGGADIMPDRDHVFYLEIPKEWKTPDLVHLFLSFGFVNVFWLNDTSVFVALKEKGFSSSVIQALENNTSYTIVTYEQYLKNMKADPTNAQEAGNNALGAGNSTLKPTSLYQSIGSCRSLHTDTRSPQTISGITPTLEKTFKDGVEGKDGRAVEKVERKDDRAVEKVDGKKRAVSPAVNPGIKRSRSIVEDKTFAEPPWD